MKYFIYIFILLLFACSGTRQFLNTNKTFKQVNYEEIEKAINDTNSKFYYPRLFQRLKNFDTTLTTDDYFHLYYGYTFQDGYSPYPVIKNNDNYMKYVTAKDEPGINDSIMKYSFLIIDEIPFYLKHYSMICYLYHKINDDEKSFQTMKIISGIIDAIMSTGNGLTEETAIHVIYISNEYDLIKILGYEFGGNQILTKKGCDYLDVKSNSFDIDGFYFNVIRLFQVNQKRQER